MDYLPLSVFFSTVSLIRRRGKKLKAAKGTLSPSELRIKFEFTI